MHNIGIRGCATAEQKKEHWAWNNNGDENMTFEEWAKGRPIGPTGTTGYMMAKSAWEDARADEREEIISAIPGGSSVDPQLVCDMIRERYKERT